MKRDRRGLVRGGIIALIGGLVAVIWLGAAPTPTHASIAQPEPITDGRIADANAMKSLLESLAYTPEDIGQGNWRIMHTRGEWELAIDLQVSPDATMVLGPLLHRPPRIARDIRARQLPGPARNAGTRLAPVLLHHQGGGRHRPVLLPRA